MFAQQLLNAAHMHAFHFLWRWKHHHQLQHLGASEIDLQFQELRIIAPQDLLELA